jgi:hypothetical protein
MPGLQVVTLRKNTAWGKINTQKKHIGGYGAALLPANYPSQGHSVFIHLISDLKLEAVKAKIAGELKNRIDEGSFICFFDNSGELRSWTYAELRAIIGRR